jgi:hypothetical protein
MPNTSSSSCERAIAATRGGSTQRISTPSSTAGGDVDTAHRAHRHHRHHHGEVLHDQEAHRDAAVQAVELALVGQQLDDDDGAGEGERHRDVQRLDPVAPECEHDAEADDDGEGELAEAGGQRHRPEVAHMVQVELETDDEQQHRDTHLRQQVDLVVRRHQVQHARAGDDADHDVGHQRRLLQAHEHRTGQRAGQQEQRDLCKRAGHRLSPRALWRRAGRRCLRRARAW